ncbi:hypothetical protein [Ornithobacterium rhinotracheale]|uniref:hypothetical protein n=1 Tax=Ornithobacterium rhinotracheale TaxID=28251 RepID=UPI00129C381B|nr:hypothetical protein [Ornithobacterium rhinotracheale]MRJ09276.1 hypothetical protein [Ornithobacterium rhinotracheale]UOH77801.1 hypothetical protein MT996_11445 [Ornithobacterium rhinotracheale]
MKQRRLPFNITLERKYNDINVERFIIDWKQSKEQRRERIINIDNDLHIELGKFNTYDIKIDEIIDLGMRYALGKQEFRKMIAQLIDYKKEEEF